MPVAVLTTVLRHWRNRIRKRLLLCYVIIFCLCILAALFCVCRSL